jgi:hypothetical protein
MQGFTLDVQMDRPRLSRATVASPDGTSVVSQSRKAQQASYDGNVDLVSDPLHNLKKRVFDFAMRETGFPFNLKGQVHISHTFSTFIMLESGRIHDNSI